MTYPDAEHYSAEQIKPGDVFKQFRDRPEKLRTLLFALIALDGSLSDETRLAAVASLNTQFAREELSRFLDSILLAIPLPEIADLDGALRLCRTAGLNRVESYLSVILDAQSSVIAVHRAWEEAVAVHFTEYHEAEEAKRLLTSSGALTALVQQVSSKTPAGVGEWVVRYASDPRLSLISRLPHLLNTIALSVKARIEHETDAHGEVIARIKSFVHEEVGRESRDPVRRKYVPLDRVKIKQAVDSQIEVISSAIMRGDLHHASRFLVELVEYQRSRGGTEYLVKSLCNVAKIAFDGREPIFARQVLDWAVEFDSTDSWAWQQFSVVLTHMGDCGLALEAARKSVQHGGGAAAYSALAEAFKAQGRYEDAIQIYDESLKKCPDSSGYARNGQAGVLKTQGKYEAALAVYDAILLDFPEDIAARNGRAEVLKAQGEYDAALAAYDETLGMFPRNPSARNGRAEVLKARGGYDAALAAYDETLGMFPRDVFARCGRAEVLKAQGEYDAALAAYDETLGMFPRDVFARCGRAEVLKAQGEYDAALAAYDETLQISPRNIFARNGRPGVLRALGEYDAALAAYDETLQISPRNIFARNGRAGVLRALGEYDAALAAYDETLRLFPRDNHTRTSRALSLILMRRIDAAREMLSVQYRKSREDWLSYHLLGLTHLRVNSLADAIRTFQDGMENTPFSDQQPHFVTALGATYIRVRKPNDAYNVLEPLNGHLDAATRMTRDLILVHASSEMGDKGRAEELFGRSSSTRAPFISDLRNALASRYGLGKTDSPVASMRGRNGDVEESEIQLIAEVLSIKEDSSHLVEQALISSECA
jgi:tetratricopeptide (TPR) repeat protein